MTYRRLVPVVAWTGETRDGESGRPIDPRLVPLLRGVAEHGTLLGAALGLGIPYRSAWALIESVHTALGAELVTATRGRGAVLTPLATQLLAADTQAAAALRKVPRGVEVAPASGARPRKAARTLAVAASHDLALAQLRDAWRLRHAVTLEFHGSEESLMLFLAGRVDVAGFHVPSEPAADDPLLARLKPSRDVRIRFVQREQGLILPPGNPDRVRRLHDLATKHVRIVNRQPGSGTRLLFDRLLAQEGVDPAALTGYTNDEFTHAAVAATVAAGNARAAFGVRAAAAQLGLAFVPLARERYDFACRRRAADSEPVLRFRALLASGATRGVVKPLPGYVLDQPGELEELPATAPRMR